MPYKNKEDKARYGRLYAARNKEKMRRLHRESYERRRQDPEYLKTHSAAERAKWQIIRRAVVNRYGGMCRCCGESRYEFLHIDHKESNGSVERAEKGRTRIFYELRDGPLRSDIQVLCSNCNLSLAWYGYCPHNPDTKRIPARRKRACR